MLLQKLNVADIEQSNALTFGQEVQREPVVTRHWRTAFAEVNEDGNIRQLRLVP
jgi:hypothetical protein